MHGIFRPDDTQVGRKQDIVAIAAKELHQKRKDAVIVQVQPYCRKILA